MKKRVAIIGAGQLGTILVLALVKKGVSITGIASRTLSSATFLAQKIDGVFATSDPQELIPLADIFFLTTPDDLLVSTCDDMIRSASDLSGKIFLHCSGSLLAEVLSSAKEKGAEIGSMHPLQTFSTSDDTVPEDLFRGILMAIEGDPGAIEMATEISELLGATPIPLDASQKALYHAAAAVVSNYSTVLFEMALSLFELAGIDREKGLRALANLSETTLHNIQATDPVSALTGPIARGDIQTVAHHIEALQKKAPQFLPAYKELGVLTLSLAEQKGGLASTQKEKLRSLFLSI